MPLLVPVLQVLLESVNFIKLYNQLLRIYFCLILKQINEKIVTFSQIACSICASSISFFSFTSDSYCSSTITFYQKGLTTGALPP
jgi:hypothetical protein